MLVIVMAAAVCLFVIVLMMAAIARIVVGVLVRVLMLRITIFTHNKVIFFLFLVQM